MARPARRQLVTEGSTNHCTWRGHNLSPVLEADDEKRYFLRLLGLHKQEYGIRIRSYSVMDTHPHVQCVSTRGQAAFSAFWKVVNHRFARWYNRRHGRRGQVVMDRMSSPIVQAGAYQLAVMRYGDLNPVRAGIVRKAKDYRWSSYRHYAFGEKDELIDDAPEYVALGPTAAHRRKAYVQLFAQPAHQAFGSPRPELAVGSPPPDITDTTSEHMMRGLSPPGVPWEDAPAPPTRSGARDPPER